MSILLFGRKTLARRVLAILARYGTNAHLYLPGVGTVNGITCGNWLDSAGTTSASVDNPVGLVLDEPLAANLGANAAPSTSSTTGFTPVASNLSSDGTSLTITNSGAAQGYAGFGTTVAGQLYKVTINVTSASGAGSVQVGGNQVPLSGVGLQTIYLAATAASGFYIGTGTAVSGNFIAVNSLNFQLVPGIPAAQATTANKPTLRRGSTAYGNASVASGNYSWEFNGTSDYLDTSIQTAASGFMIIGMRADVAQYGDPISSTSIANASGDAGISIKLRNDGSTVWLQSGNGDGNATHITSTQVSGAYSVSSPVVLSGVWTYPGSQYLYKNGTQVGSSAMSYSPLGTLGFSIGSSGVPTDGEGFKGQLYPCLVGAGSITAADLLTLQRFIGQLTGPTGVSF